MIDRGRPFSGLPRVFQDYPWVPAERTDYNARRGRNSTFDLDLGKAANFTFDSAVKPGPGIVPYNSTLRYRGKNYPLAAPFLDLGHGCRGHDNKFTSMGTCTCHNGTPLRSDWWHEDNKVCVSDVGFAWGFSRSVTFIGLVLEWIWAFLSCLLWVMATYRSRLQTNLANTERMLPGTIRDALDLAESINRDLGPDYIDDQLSEQELQKRLARCGPVGYAVGIAKGTGKCGARLVSKPPGESRVEIEDLEHNEAFSLRPPIGRHSPGI